MDRTHWPMLVPTNGRWPRTNIVSVRCDIVLWPVTVNLSTAAILLAWISMEHLCKIWTLSGRLWNRSIRQMAMPDLEPCRSNTKRQKLGSNGSSVLDPGSSSNGNRKIPRVRLDRVWNLFRCCWLWPGSSPHAVMASSNAISVRWAGHWAMVLLGPAGTCGQWNTKHSQSGGLIHFTLRRK